MTKLATISHSQDKFFDAVIGERIKQDAIWGGSEYDRTHPIYVWTGILRERVISLSQMTIENPPTEVQAAKVRRLFIEIAAVACAAYEAIT